MALDAGEQETEEPVPEETAPPPGRRDRVLVYLTEHQAKGQFVQMARRLIETGILKPSALDLARKYDDMAPRQIEWPSIRRHVNRLSIRDLTAAIIPALYAYPGAVLIVVDDMTSLTPTQQAFWLAVFEHLRPGDFPPLSRNRPLTLQINLGRRCNQQCLHCHVAASLAGLRQLSALGYGEPGSRLAWIWSTTTRIQNRRRRRHWVGLPARAAR